MKKYLVEISLDFDAIFEIDDSEGLEKVKSRIESDLEKITISSEEYKIKLPSVEMIRVKLIHEA